LNARVFLRFTITQHIRDIELLKILVKFLNCGSVAIRSNKTAADFVVKNFSDITEKIIPFFQKYSIQGVKKLDFENFCIVANIMKNKGHLTVEGLKQIKILKSKMNTAKQDD
jgi:hypothetical protein